MASLNVIALISGGKDSFFSMLHCIAQGHRIIALANLYPERKDEEDLNSYMYQTIGHNIIPLYAQALELPLYRGVIRGDAVNISQTYHPDKNDEIESLTSLLRDVIEKHPEANAVSAGAILSTYQRTRVESVAIRLGLTPLAYLWQYPYLQPYTQSSLLHDMAAIGQDSRIIKVASGGLDDRHLWMNVSDMKVINKLGKDMSRFGAGEVGAILGEGGEFETLALDGPATLWRGRIAVDDTDVDRVSLDGGSAILRIRNTRVIKKSDAVPEDNTSRLQALRKPPLWDVEFVALLDRMRTTATGVSPHTRRLVEHWEQSPVVPLQTLKHASDEDEFLFMSNMTSARSDTAALQMRDIRRVILSTLARKFFGSHDIAFTTILLRSMSDFASFNAEYSRLYDGPSPPSRVTVACGDRMPSGIHVMVSIIVHSREPEPRYGLHVQSLSYWAPANIGPYSQAITVPTASAPEKSRGAQIVYVAGQIPLVPASMELVSGDFTEQTVLSLQHLWRIGRATGVHYWANVVVYITAGNDEEAEQRAIIAADAWRGIHAESAALDDDLNEEDAEDFDAGDRALYNSWGHKREGQDHDKTPRSPLPHWDRVVLKAQDERERASMRTPTCNIVQVAGLPRGAQIEWSAIGLIAGQDQIELQMVDGTLCVESGGLSMMMKCYDDHPAEINDADSFGEIFATTSPRTELVQQLQAMVVPCKAVFDANGVHHAAAIRTRCSVV